MRKTSFGYGFLFLLLGLASPCLLALADDKGSRSPEKRAAPPPTQTVQRVHIGLSKIEPMQSNIALNVDKRIPVKVTLYDLDGKPIQGFLPELRALGLPAADIQCEPSDELGVAYCSFLAKTEGKKVFFLRNINLPSAPIVEVEIPTQLVIQSLKPKEIPEHIVPAQFQRCDSSDGKKLPASKIACWGWWDSGSCAGDDTRMCGSFGGQDGSGQTGCIIPASKCASGRAKAVSAKSLQGKSTCLLTVWEYACE